MNTEKKLELISNALVAESKVLFAHYFSSEEVEIGQKVLIKTTEEIPMQLFMQSLPNLSKTVFFWQLPYQTLRLYWRLRQIKAEIPALISDSLDRLEEDFGCPLNFQLPLTLSGAISLLIDNEITHFFNEINCRSLFSHKSIQKTVVKHKN